MVSPVIDVNGEQVLGAQQPAIAVPVGGTAIDVEARATLGQNIECLSVHGLFAQS